MKTIKVNKPRFIYGNILKKEMLENMRDFSYDFMGCLYGDLSDGIVSGFKPVPGEDFKENPRLKISSGIVKHKSDIFLIPEVDKLDCESAIGKKMAIKLILGDKSEDEDWETLEVKIAISEPNVAYEGAEFELGRFSLQSKDELKTDYNTLNDFETINFYNVVNAKYAGYGTESTLSPAITKTFAKSVLSKAKKPTSQLMSKVGLFLNNRTVEKNLLVHFIRSEAGVTQISDTASNEDLFKELKSLEQRLK
ncbi:MAG: hypothetical protein FWF80_09090 [Defluviitaleaceae bacterium]|nr:hypothetical protein [Defluviitaleaceae bacterium]